MDPIFTTTNTIATELFKAKHGDKYSVETNEGYYIEEKPVTVIQETSTTRTLIIGRKNSPHFIVHVEESKSEPLSDYKVTAHVDTGEGREERGDVNKIQLKGFDADVHMKHS